MSPLDGALRWARIAGPEGLLMLGCSILLIGLSGGVTLILAGGRILATARACPTAVAPAGIGVVHGKRLKDGAIDADYAARLRRARALLDAGSIDRVVILGGSRDGAAPSEAEAGRGFLLARGTPEATILTERTSRHTLDNIRNLRALVGPGTGRGMVLVSSRYHLARCRAMARDCGLEVRLCAAEPHLVLDTRLAVRLTREAFLLHWYEVGRALSRLLRYRRALARIA